MSQKFLSLKEFPMLMNFSNKQLKTDAEKICFRDGIRWIRVKTVGEYDYKNSFNDDKPWKTVIIGTEFEPFDPPMRTEITRPVAEIKLCKKATSIYSNIFPSFLHEYIKHQCSRQ